jgi:hypothetical protein
MFDEEKVKKDLEKMRKAYEKALKDLNEIKARQDRILKDIYEVRKQTLTNSSQ